MMGLLIFNICLLACLLGYFIYIDRLEKRDNRSYTAIESFGVVRREILNFITKCREEK